MARAAFAVAVLALWCGAALVLAQQPRGAGGSHTSPPPSSQRTPPPAGAPTPTPTPTATAGPQSTQRLAPEGACAEGLDGACPARPPSGQGECPAGGEGCSDAPSPGDAPLSEQVYGKWRTVMGYVDKGSSPVCPDLLLSPLPLHGATDYAFAAWNEEGAVKSDLPEGRLRLLGPEEGHVMANAILSAEHRAASVPGVPAKFLWVMQHSEPFLDVGVLPRAGLLSGRVRGLVLRRLPFDPRLADFQAELKVRVAQADNTSAPWYLCPAAVADSGALLLGRRRSRARPLPKE